MKAWIISDIHATSITLSQLDRLDVPEAEVCICAGDISGIVEFSVEFLQRHIVPWMPVVTCLGNHDYYGSTIDHVLESAKQSVSENLTILENETVVLGDTRIVGATLWTDFEIEHGSDVDELPLSERKALSINICKRYMMDFQAIYRSARFDDGMPGLLTAKELIARHVESRDFISGELAKPFHGKTIVLSHHAPSPRSLHPEFLGHPSNGAFASDLTALIHQGKPDLWVHGHVHHHLDYYEGVTRVLCNPRGYWRERGHTGFVQNLVIDI
ncbi:metallophosphoesterase [uncultured Rhizobium sp.]|uniref:metallophosphoesterase n=1 Tax=unclassified Neorhizobium TaxID=2629175 RepID=UPI002D7EAFAD|nr:metallophosphoesterase [uncultured Rhizobium sp.]